MLAAAATAVAVPPAASYCFLANKARYGGWFLNQPFPFLREMFLDENSFVIILSQEM